MLKLAAVLLCLFCVPAARAETVHSLDEVPGRIRTPEGKKVFDQEMDGKPAPDGLGVHLPPALGPKAVTDLLVPAEDHDVKTLVGAKPWPGRPDSYVAIVCTGGEAPYDPKEPDCKRARSDDAATPLHVYIGVIEVKDGAAPRLVARSASLDTPVAWTKTGLTERPRDADDAKDAAIRPDSIEEFDLAAYRIAPDALAFGVRAGWSEGYSGGLGNFTALYLLMIDGDKLRQVLAVPMSAYKDTAGDWHEDGTRDHDITDMANVIVMAPQQTDGHFDLLVKGRTARFQRLFRWSKAAGAYQPAKG